MDPSSLPPQRLLGLCPVVHAGGVWTDLSAIAGSLVDQPVVLPASLLQPVADLVPGSDKGHPVYTGHDCLLHQLAVHVVTQHGGFRNASSLVHADLLLHQLSNLCVNILQHPASTSNGKATKHWHSW